jgi:methionine synthase I (cobalamin-dependent)
VVRYQEHPVFAPSDPTARLASGGPVVLAADPVASLRRKGYVLADDGDVGELVRGEPHVLAELHAEEISAGADVVVTLTADTTPRSLGRLGMAFRAAALSAAAVDEAHGAVSRTRRPVLVAGVLGPSVPLPADAQRIDEELETHAARLATAGCQVLIARGGPVSVPSPELGRRAFWSAVLRARATGRDTWAVAEVRADGALVDGGSVAELVTRLGDEGVAALLFDGDHDAQAHALDEAGRRAPQVHLGVFVGAPANGTRGAPATGEGDADGLRESIVRLRSGGARLFGGARGTTSAFTRSLVAALRAR